MERVIVTEATPDEIERELLPWAKLEENLLDEAMLQQASAFVLCARAETGRLAYLPVQQPLMLESHVFAPGLDDRRKSLAMARLTERAVAEAWRRDAGEVFFLSQRPETARFAARHGFSNVREGFGLETYLLSLREMFAA
jgi:N-acetylglutamate synthase-like GNAT family acetyltransferase